MMHALLLLVLATQLPAPLPVFDAVPAALAVRAEPLLPPIHKQSAAPYRSPPGYHRHLMLDGSIIEHHDSNHGNPAAHAGVAPNWPQRWPKYTGPLPATVAQPQQQICPT